MARRKKSTDSEMTEFENAEEMIAKSMDDLADTTHVRDAVVDTLMKPISLDELPPPPTTGVTEGRMVHYVISNGDHRPSVIVNAWKDQGYGHGEVNLTVFLDWQNDLNPKGIDWQTSVPFDDDQKRPGTWHWIEPA